MKSHRTYPMHRFRITQFIQISRNSPLELGTGLVERSQSSLKRDSVAAKIAIGHRLFLALLEATEVVLDEEGGVELANGDLVIDSRWWNDLIEQLRTRTLPNLLDCRSKL